MAGRPTLEIGTHGDIAVYPVKGKEGVYEAATRYRDSDGKTRKVGARGATAAKAKAALRERLRDRAARTESDTLTPDSTVEALVRQWLATLEPKRRSVTEVRAGSLADGTVDSYIDTAERFVIPGMGAVRLRELSTQRAQAYLSKTTSNRHHIRTVLMQACTWGVRMGALTHNPVRDTEPPPPSRPDRRVLDVDDIMELARRTVEYTQRPPGKGGPPRGSDILEIIALLMATGERTGEVLGLRWEDVAYLDDETRPAAVTIAGKVSHGKYELFPKSEHGYRTLQLPSYGREALLRMRARGLPFPWVFPSRAGTPRWNNNVNRTWREIRGADYDWVVPRSFRKTAATAVEAEYGADAAAAQLGHASPDVTRRHYIRRAIEVADHSAALERFDPFSFDNRSSEAVQG
ncbi:hypothetical protein BST28_17580 [Mycolicibacter kumamotonensis]|uniref:Tyr recombinase domain-containing protein n=1 Tax=Mycolicibacter kumamotonensis TaxID=354243 RepID=A0A1X0DYR5_9MYCO|nr:tyrosine-type recombinase/integrase [Mycolicibacter kumamotonensis]ORA77614.1 hypothetical protein BST28_17580 [Mycolicibacter kumamotonensis]